jgi:Sortase domain
MRKEWGTSAHRSLLGALILALATTSNVLAARSPDLVRTAIGEGRPAAVALGAMLDKAAIAPSRERARLGAVAAAYASTHRAAPAPKPHVTQAPKRPTTPNAVVRNHLWVPALGINRSVSWFPCSRSSGPDNYVYRWGCAGHNNVYLLGHAYGVFKPLHDAYLSGRLRVGMVAIYADGSGHITRYRLTAWHVVSPLDISWSGATSSRTLTLQTCIGSNSQYRLDVRFVAY